jgi:hypothetical protein
MAGTCLRLLLMPVTPVVNIYLQPTYWCSKNTLSTKIKYPYPES